MKVMATIPRKLVKGTVGTFDFAIMECGQYNEKWSKIHVFPEQTT